jgi:hypothetical protein
MGDLPAGVLFSPNPLPQLADNTVSYQRTQVSSGNSNFYARDWTPKPVSQTAVNVGQAVRPLSSAPRIIINEVNPNAIDFVELYNYGCSVVNLQGYQLEIYSEYELPVFFTFPAMSIDPGSEVMTVSDNTSPGVNEVYIGRNINWVAAGSAAAVLRDPNDHIVDFYHLRGVTLDVMGDLPSSVSFGPNPLPSFADTTLSYQRAQVVQNTLHATGQPGSSVKPA